MPILEDLHRHLCSNPKAEQMSIILNRFVNGSVRTMFNGQTNVDLSNPYTVLDLTFLKNKIMLSAGMFVALDMVWDIARQNRIEPKAIAIDEAWQLIGSHSNALAGDYMVELAKLARAYNTLAIFATQDISDFFSLEDGKYGKAIIAACKCKIVLNLEPHEAEIAGEILNLTATEVHKIKNFERGHRLLSSNGNNIAVRFQASELERSLISTDPEELRQILEVKKSKNPLNDV